MNRYQKANEGIHAPEKLKKKAVRSDPPRHYAHWVGAAAAVLAVVLLGGIVLRPWAMLPEARAAVLARAKYPKMAPYPKDEDYFNERGEGNHNAYNKAWTAWRDSRDRLAANSEFYELDDFTAASCEEFLGGAGKENCVYSPLNVYMALAMLAETAGGNSRQQILDLLGEDSMESLRSTATALWRSNYRNDGVVTSIMANSLWLRDGTSYSQKVLDTLAKQYYASSFSGKMGSEEYTQALRDWINEQTNGLLEEEAGGLELSADTVMALASTLYYKAAWRYEFHTENTERETFHASSGDVDTDFMHKTTDTTYYWGDNFAAVALPFQNGGQMWFILPDEGYSVDKLLNSGEAMNFLLQRPADGEKATVYSFQKYLEVHLAVPRFDVSSNLNLVDGLKNLGVTDVFDMDAADFTPLEASTDEPLYIEKADHAARVMVDEEGCEAAAYTVWQFCTGMPAPPDDEVDFVLDRPFLFAVTESGHLPLFVGVVNEP